MKIELQAHEIALLSEAIDVAVAQYESDAETARDHVAADMHAEIAELLELQRRLEQQNA